MSRSEQEIQDWLVQRVGQLTGTPQDEIDVREPMLRYGLDSVAVVTLTADVEKWVSYRFRENPLEEHLTIAALARFLAEQTKRGSDG